DCLGCVCSSRAPPDQADDDRRMAEASSDPQERDAAQSQRNRADRRLAARAARKGRALGETNVKPCSGPSSGKSRKDRKSRPQTSVEERDMTCRSASYEDVQQLPCRPVRQGRESDSYG